MTNPWLPHVFIEFKKIRRHFSSWIILGGMFAFSAFLFRWHVISYTHQAQLALEHGERIYGITREVIKPFWGWVMFMILLSIPVLTHQWLSLEKKSRFYFYHMHRMPLGMLLMCKALSIMLWISISISMLSLIPLSLATITSLDWGLFISGALTVWLCSLFILSLNLLVCIAITNPLVSFILNYIMIIGLAFLPALNGFGIISKLLQSFAYLNYAHHLMNGRLILADILFFVCLSTLCLFVSSMLADRNYKRLT